MIQTPSMARSLKQFLSVKKYTDFDNASSWNKILPKYNDYDHLSLGCNLLPRMSESNLGFHDICWKRETENFALMRRHVKVNKIIKSFSIRAEANKQLSNTLNNERFYLEVCLLQRQREYNRGNIVSNVHLTPVPVHAGRLSLISASSSVLIRSNYAQKEVIVRMILKHGNNDIGTIELELLNNQGNISNEFLNKFHSHLFGGLRLSFDISDMPQHSLAQSDLLPDVIICDEKFVGLFAGFRQLMCRSLAGRDENRNFGNNSQTTTFYRTTNPFKPGCAIRLFRL